MKYQAVKKVDGGKLLRIKIEADGNASAGNRINKIAINGDFFLHPEEALPAVEKSIIGLGVREPDEHFIERINEALRLHKASFIGVSPTDIAATIKEAMLHPM